MTKTQCLLVAELDYPEILYPESESRVQAKNRKYIKYRNWQESKYRNIGMIYTSRWRERTYRNIICCQFAAYIYIYIYMYL